MNSRACGPSGRPPRLRPAGQAAGALALVAALAASAALAYPVRYLARDEVLCDSKRLACVDGTLSYEVNSRLLELHGRVQFTTVPGMLQIVVRGSNRLGHVRYAPLEIRLKGKASEIVDFRMIPDYPDVDNWTIDHISFVPTSSERPAPVSDSAGTVPTLVADERGQPVRGWPRRRVVQKTRVATSLPQVCAISVPLMS